MNFKKFKANTARLEAVLNLKTMDEFEDAFWNSWEVAKIEQLYAIDNKGSLFSDNCKMWNLGKFSRNESLIHGQVWFTIAYNIMEFRTTFYETQNFAEFLAFFLFFPSKLQYFLFSLNGSRHLNLNFLLFAIITIYNLIFLVFFSNFNEFQFVSWRIMVSFTESRHIVFK